MQWIPNQGTATNTNNDGAVMVPVVTGLGPLGPNSPQGPGSGLGGSVTTPATTTTVVPINPTSAPSYADWAGINYNYKTYKGPNQVVLTNTSTSSVDVGVPVEHIEL